MKCTEQSMENIQIGFWVKKGQELSGAYTFDNLAQRGIEISKKISSFIGAFNREKSRNKEFQEKLAAVI